MTSAICIVVLIQSPFSDSKIVTTLLKCATWARTMHGSMLPNSSIHQEDWLRILKCISRILWAIVRHLMTSNRTFWQGEIALITHNVWVEYAPVLVYVQANLLTNLVPRLRNVMLIWLVCLRNNGHSRPFALCCWPWVIIARKITSVLMEWCALTWIQIHPSLESKTVWGSITMMMESLLVIEQSITMCRKIHFTMGEGVYPAFAGRLQALSANASPLWMWHPTMDFRMILPITSVQLWAIITIVSTSLPTMMTRMVY